jgi:hypothetical protein
MAFNEVLVNLLKEMYKNTVFTKAASTSLWPEKRISADAQGNCREILH